MRISAAELSKVCNAANRYWIFSPLKKQVCQGSEDYEVLEIAASQERVLVTHDRKTMPAAFGAFATQRQSSGVLIVPQSLPVVVAIEELLLVWAASDAEDWINVISPIPL